MSYEGYVQHVCECGQTWTTNVPTCDDNHDDICPKCKKQAIIENSVDDTNCEMSGFDPRFEFATETDDILTKEQLQPLLDSYLSVSAKNKILSVMRSIADTKNALNDAINELGGDIMRTKDTSCYHIKKAIMKSLETSRSLVNIANVEVSESVARMDNKLCSDLANMTCTFKGVRLIRVPATDGCKGCHFECWSWSANPEDCEHQDGCRKNLPGECDGKCPTIWKKQ